VHGGTWRASFRSRSRSIAWRQAPESTDGERRREGSGERAVEFLQRMAIISTGVLATVMTNGEGRTGPMSCDVGIDTAAEGVMLADRKQ
jgi:hypothetical protein